jgi:hypothetical protein
VPHQARHLIMPQLDERPGAADGRARGAYAADTVGGKS